MIHCRNHNWASSTISNIWKKEQRKYAEALYGFEAPWMALFFHKSEFHFYEEKCHPGLRGNHKTISKRGPPCGIYSFRSLLKTALKTWAKMFKTDWSAKNCKNTAKQWVSLYFFVLKSFNIGCVTSIICQMQTVDASYVDLVEEKNMLSIFDVTVNDFKCQHLNLWVKKSIWAMANIHQIF